MTANAEAANGSESPSRNGHHRAMPSKEPSTLGWTWGTPAVGKDGLELYDENSKLILSLPSSMIAGATMVNHDLAIEMGLGDDDETGAGRDDELLTELRFFAPSSTHLEHLHQEVMNAAGGAGGLSGSVGAVGDKMASFSQVPLVLPRGHFDIDFLSTALKFRGKSSDYQVRYNNVNKLIMVVKPDGVHVAVVLGLDKPIRQGNTVYTFLVFQLDINTRCTGEEISLPEGTDYEAAGLERSATGSLVDTLQKLLKLTTKLPIQFPTPELKSTNGKSCVRCSHRATEGLLYGLKKAFLFVTKPVVYLKFDDIAAVEFSRAESWATQTRFFDLKFFKKGENGSIDFQQIDKGEYQSIIDFLQANGIRIRNIQKPVVAANQSRQGEEGEESGDDEDLLPDEDDEDDEDAASDSDLESDDSSGSDESGSSESGHDDDKMDE